MISWISVKKSLPKKGRTVDIYIEDYEERWTDYVYIENYGGQAGNSFFEPVHGGITCITNATHWMYSPEKPE